MRSFFAGLAGQTKAAAVKKAETNAHAALPPVSLGAVVWLPPADYEKTRLANLIMQAGGKSEEPAYMRIIGEHRAGQACRAGTDRTETSDIYAFRSDAAIMRENGVRNPGEMTYLRPIADRVAAPPPGKAVLIYSKRNIRNVTCANQVHPFPNN